MSRWLNDVSILLVWNSRLVPLDNVRALIIRICRALRYVIYHNYKKEPPKIKAPKLIMGQVLGMFSDGASRASSDSSKIREIP